MLDLGQVQGYLRTMNTGDDAAKREVVRTLKHHEPSEWDALSDTAVAPLIEILRQHLRHREGTAKAPPVFRQDVSTVLGNIGPRSESAVPQLIELLADGVTEGVREAAATALGRIGKASRPAVDRLLALLDADCRASLASRVARALGDIGCADQRVKAALNRLWMITAACPASRAQVAIALCKLRIDARGLLPALAGTLVSSPNAPLRKASAEALSWANKADTDVVPALTAALSDNDEDVRRLAEAGLEQMKLTHDKAVRICAKQLKEASHAETALRKVGAASVPALIEAMASEEPLAREKAARTLGAIGEPAKEAAEVLGVALRDKTPEVRLASAKALWNITHEGEAVVKVLSALLQGTKTKSSAQMTDARRQFLQTVIEALHRIGPSAKAALPALEERVNDENRLIRESAQRAIREISPPVPVPSTAGAR